MLGVNCDAVVFGSAACAEAAPSSLLFFEVKTGSVGQEEVC